MIVDLVDNISRYKGFSEEMDKALEHISILIPQYMKSGRLDVDGDKVYANCMSYETSFSSGLWEVHQKYIDIHIPVMGKEIIQLAEVERLQIHKEYDETVEAALYSGDPDCSILSEPGKFIVFFPGEVHRTAVAAESIETINKMVIKVRF